jgi:IS4 transposase
MFDVGMSPLCWAKSEIRKRSFGGGIKWFMPELRALTPEEFERAAYRLRNPAPGSRIEAAKNFGVDLTLLIEQLRLTPAERVARLEQTSQALTAVRGAAQKRS